MFILAMSLLGVVSTRATVITVNNLGGGDYSNLVDAYNAATNGDTIYVEPTDIDYGDLMGSNRINKRLTWVGVGHNPDNDGSTQSIVDYFELDTGASGSRFYGLIIDRLYSSASTAGPVDSLLVEGCRILRWINMSSVPARNVVVRNSIFTFGGYSIFLHDADSLINKSSLLVTNCFFNANSRIEGYNNPLNTVIIDHCIIYYRFNTFTDGLNGAIIKNSYFYVGGTASGSNNIFLNNIVAQNGDVGLTNNGSNNQFNTSMSFVNYGGTSNWSASQDYHLNPGSNGIGDATDGTDIGIHGGNSNFSESGETLWIPIMRSLNFQSAPIPLVQPGDTLNITIEASRPQID